MEHVEHSSKLKLTFGILDEADPEREPLSPVGHPELDEGGVLRGEHGRQGGPLLLR